MRKHAIGAGIAVIAAIALAGCTGQSEPEPTPTPFSTAGPYLPDSIKSMTPAPNPSDVPPDDGVTPGYHEAPEWDEESRQAATDAAVKAMTAFARPSLDYDTWWAELEPLLTVQAAQDYAYVDPAAVPASSVTGPGVIVDDTSAYLARVEVPTDAGTYTIIVSRADAGSPWLVSRFTPPEEEN
ncbi:hypothetical protein [Microbacterium sp. NPDC055683]